MNATYTGLVEHFGKALATRIYSCAMLMGVYEEEGIEVAVRYTIGALKRMRRQGTKHVSWTDVIERLENEQVESRHYSIATALTQDIKRIEEWNKQSESEHKAANFVLQAVQAEEDRYNTQPEEQMQVREWVKAYWENIGTRKSVYLSRVVNQYRKGVALTARQSEAIIHRYSPKGVRTTEFLELMIRYA